MFLLMPRPKVKTNPVAVDTLISCFESARDLRRIVAKQVIDPSGLSLAEADILYAAHCIATGKEENLKLTPKGFALLSDIESVAVYEAYEAAKMTRILASLVKSPGLIQLAKINDTEVVGDSSDLCRQARIHGNSKCLRLTPAGVEVATKLDERYKELANNLVAMMPKKFQKKLQAQVEVNDWLSQMAKGFL